MSAITNLGLSVDALPPVPLTLEGSSVLHQMFRIRRPEWRALDGSRRAAVLKQAGRTRAEIRHRELESRKAG